MVEIEPTRVKFKIWDQHVIAKLAGVTLGRGSNSGLYKIKFYIFFYMILQSSDLSIIR